jgi:hypothetical protein
VLSFVPMLPCSLMADPKGQELWSLKHTRMLRMQFVSGVEFGMASQVHETSD